VSIVVSATADVRAALEEGRKPVAERSGCASCESGHAEDGAVLEICEQDLARGAQMEPRLARCAIVVLRATLPSVVAPEQSINVCMPGLALLAALPECALCERIYSSDPSPQGGLGLAGRPRGGRGRACGALRGPQRELRGPHARGLIWLRSIYFELKFRTVQNCQSLIVALHCRASTSDSLR
jgi:hypothetical protein